MQPNTSDAHSGWTITTQAEDLQMGPGGNYIPGVKVNFQTGLGNEGSVFIPRNMYAPDYVRAMVEAKAVQLDSVSLMSADPT